MQEALNRGLLPDDSTLKQLSLEPDSIVHGRSLESMQWPDADLRLVLIRKLPVLVSAFRLVVPSGIAASYPIKTCASCPWQ